MQNLSEELNRVLILLEDAEVEQDWKLVSAVIKELDRLYDELDRFENNQFYDEY